MKENFDALQPNQRKEYETMASNSTPPEEVKSSTQMRAHGCITAYRIQDQIRSALGSNAPTYNEEMVQQFRDLWANSGAGNSPQIVSKRNNGRGTTKKQKATATVSEPNLFVRLPQLTISVQQTTVSD